MSSRALLNDLRVIEFPMRYQERVGTSKLSVFRDGIRFAQVIFAGVLCYRPERLLLALFSFCVVLIALLASYPVEFYFQHGRLEEWMIYRFVVCQLLGSFAWLLLLTVALANQLASFGPRRKSADAFWPSLIARLLRGKTLGVLLLLLTGVSAWFLWPGIVEYATTGHVSLHWSRLLAGAFSLFSTLQTAVFALLLSVVALWLRQGSDSEMLSVQRTDPPAKAPHVYEARCDLQPVL